MIGMTTVSVTVPRRRVVRRARPTLEQAWDVVLAELPIELRPLVRRYAENMREGQQIRAELGTAMTRNGTRWLDVDRLVQSLD